MTLPRRPGFVPKPFTLRAPKRSLAAPPPDPCAHIVAAYVAMEDAGVTITCGGEDCAGECRLRCNLEGITSTAAQVGRYLDGNPDARASARDQAGQPLDI